MPKPSKTIPWNIEILHEIVSLGTRLVGARYGALGLLNERQDAFSCFVTAGINEATRAAFGPARPDQDLLAATVLDPRPLRMKNVVEDSRAAGFPHHLLPLGPFLAVPLLSGKKKVLGSLYAADDRETPEFGTMDQCLLQKLARLAVDMMEETKGYEEVRRCLRLFGEALDDRSAALITNAAREIVLWNEGAQRLFGYTAQEVLGKRFEEVLIPLEEMENWRENFNPRIRRDMQDGKKILYIAPRLHKDGRRIPVRADLFPIIHVTAGVKFIMIVAKMEEVWHGAARAAEAAWSASAALNGGSAGLNGGSSRNAP